ncbi:MAG: putative TrmH family tRNA/rRNA methyltransferase [Firmicutes bacterium ADurb.Bin193]|nr:MAG: putative TrmH family tRNA/rRNA methyltransferase [Firmicutes bacterium ADurb.Bin193]
MYKEISSVSNQTYKKIKALQTKKGRAQFSAFAAEGIKSVCDALAAKAPVLCIAVSEAFRACNPQLMAYFSQQVSGIYVVSDKIFGGLCDAQAPQGVLCTVAIGPVGAPADIIDKRRGLWVYCDRISDPGNAGTVVRTADAAGAGGVIFSQGCADIYSPKAVRSAMGSLCHIPVLTECGAEVLAAFGEKGFRVAAGALSDQASDYRKADLRGDMVIVIGSEANGVSDEVMGRCDCAVKIPILGSAESLNASVAAGILIYEWVRNQTAPH